MTRTGWLSLGGLAAAVATGLVLLPGEWIAAADARLAGWRPWLGGLRTAAILGAWIWWDELVARIPGLTPEASAHLRARRHFWCGALAAVELVLVRNVFGALWRVAA